METLAAAWDHYLTHAPELSAEQLVAFDAAQGAGHLPHGPVSKAHLQAFCDKVQAAMDAHSDKQGYSATNRSDVSFMWGRKYARIVKTRRAGGQRSVYGFICKATGDMYKADGWNGPARNYTRGNIFHPGNTANLSPWSIS